MKLNKNTSLTLISLYGLLERIGKLERYSETTMHRLLSDLTGILNGHINGKRNIILGGDLNISIQWDEKYGKNILLMLIEYYLKELKILVCLIVLNLSSKITYKPTGTAEAQLNGKMIIFL